MITIDNVTKIYEGNNRVVHAIDDLSLMVRENEIIAIVGPSGCGKSTLINLVAGFTSVTSGRVLVAGHNVRGPNRRCGVVFQEDAVFPWMRVRKNVEYGLRFTDTKRSEIDRIVIEYLDLVGLGEEGDTWPRDLSGGMRKRTELARAYAANPDILLLDEAFGSLDVLTREDMQVLLQAVWARHPKTILLVTHDVEEALYLGSRVVVMNSNPGRIATVYKVPFEYPRKRSLKLTPAFVSLREEVTNALKDQSALNSQTDRELI